MKTIVVMMMVGCAVAAAIFLVLRLGLPAQLWLWGVGLAGPVVGLLQFILQQVRKLVEQDDVHQTNPRP